MSPTSELPNAVSIFKHKIPFGVVSCGYTDHRRPLLNTPSTRSGGTSAGEDSVQFVCDHFAVPRRCFLVRLAAAATATRTYCLLAGKGQGASVPALAQQANLLRSARGRQGHPKPWGR